MVSGDMMKERRKFGAWLRQRRLRAGFRSAASFARACQLAPSHIAMFERGAVLPRWTTALHMADVLRLDGAGRSEFFAAIDTASKPAVVRESLAAPTAA